MILIVGLGNPGTKHAFNRHNIGFMAADEIVRRHEFGPWRNKFQASVSEGRLGDSKALVMKPQTFMNESGRSIAEAVRFYKCEPGDVVVIHDELDLDPGRFRYKSGGGHGGHNGLRSVTRHTGDEFQRIRIGIGHPGRKDLVHRYVLHDFARADHQWIEPMLAAIADNLGYLADADGPRFQNAVHHALNPQHGANKAVSTGRDKAEQAADRELQQTRPRSALADGLARLFGRN